MENKRLNEFKKLKKKGLKWKDCYATAEILEELNLSRHIDKINRLINILENDEYITKHKKYNLIVWKIPSNRWDFLKDMAEFSLKQKENTKKEDEQGEKSFVYSREYTALINKLDAEARKFIAQAKSYATNNEFNIALEYYEKSRRIYQKINDNTKIVKLNEIISKISDLRDSFNEINLLKNEAEELFKLAEKYRKNNEIEDAINCYIQAQTNYKQMNENRTVQDLEILIQDLKRKSQNEERTNSSS